MIEVKELGMCGSTVLSNLVTYAEKASEDLESSLLPYASNDQDIIQYGSTVTVLYIGIVEVIWPDISSKTQPNINFLPA